MGDPFTVVILVAAGGASDPTTYAIERAANAALGRGTRVVVHESAGTPTDGEALAASPETGQSAIVEMTWGDGGHRVAVLRVHLAGGERWLDRTIGFGATDADSERARTIGFALASMIPESNPSPPAVPAPAAETVSVAAVAREPDRGSSENASEARHFALDLFATGAAGLGASVDTAGGGGALEAFVAPLFALRFGGAVRAGSVPAVQGSALTLVGTAGLALHPWRPSAAHPVGGSLRLDYVVVGQSLSHVSPAGSTTSTRARALSGADAVAELEWRWAPGVELLLGAGLEEMFATTYVDLNGARVATLPPLGALAEAGLRLPF
jgi:hypothetical protein